jgi:pSer/pThr/pTyr-binding forkhead associated (FHA) protein
MPFLEMNEDLREVTSETTIGSGAQASWRIANKDLAARHFTIRLNGTEATIAPASNQNVVVVNGQQVPPHGAALTGGDVITAGSVRLVFLTDRNAPRPRQAAPGEWYLIEPGSRQAFRLRKRTVPIGRDAASGIHIKDLTVSRFHADVRSEAGGYVLYSSGTTGTYVNGQRLSTPRLLQSGDTVKLGDTTLTFTQTVPTGIRVVEPQIEEDSLLSRRPTVLDQSTIAHTGAATGGSKAWLGIVGVVLAAALGAMYFVLR